MSTEVTNILTVNGGRCSVKMDIDCDSDGTNLLKLPGLIDPHVHFRTPGMEYKEDWNSGAFAALHGGYTTVFDMPNNVPSINTQENLMYKRGLINKQLQTANIPLRYNLFFGADRNNFDQIYLVKDNIIGIKVFMSSSTGDLLVDDISSLHALYAIASRFGLIVALHAEDEKMIHHNMSLCDDSIDYFKRHSLVRNVDVAVSAVRTVVHLSDLYNVRSYILHVSSQQELDVINDAKNKGVPVYAETCPHYLFFSINDYDELQGLVKMNPPLRDSMQHKYLWEAINTGLIDTIASDHAPHTLEEKNMVHNCPSGIPGIETTLALLLTACYENKISLNTVLNLTYNNPKKIFSIPDNDDYILVDINNYHKLNNEDLYTKVKWSPYAGRKVTGYVKYVTINGKSFMF